MKFYACTPKENLVEFRCMLYLLNDPITSSISHAWLCPSKVLTIMLSYPKIFPTFFHFYMTHFIYISTCLTSIITNTFTTVFSNKHHWFKSSCYLWYKDGILVNWLGKSHGLGSSSMASNLLGLFYIDLFVVFEIALLSLIFGDHVQRLRMFIFWFTTWHSYKIKFHS